MSMVLSSTGVYPLEFKFTSNSVLTIVGYNWISLGELFRDGHKRLNSLQRWGELVSHLDILWHPIFFLPSQQIFNHVMVT